MDLGWKGLGGAEGYDDWLSGMMMKVLGPKPGQFLGDLGGNLKDSLTGNISESKKAGQEAMGLMKGNPSLQAFREHSERLGRIQEEGNRNTSKMIEQNSVNPYKLKDDKPSRVFKPTGTE